MRPSIGAGINCSCPFCSLIFSSVRVTNPRSTKVRGFNSAAMIWQRDADKTQHFFVVKSQNGSYLEGQIFIVSCTFPVFISLPTEKQKICGFTCHQESP